LKEDRDHRNFRIVFQVKGGLQSTRHELTSSLAKANWCQGKRWHIWPI